MNSGGRSVAFARVVFNFDQSLINLKSEITVIGQMSTIVEKTTMNQANSSGRVVIVAASSPGDIPPNGIFEFASFDIDSNTTLTDATVEIIFDTFDSQIVDKLGPEIPATYTNAFINVFGITEPTVTSIVTPTITPGGPTLPLPPYETGVFFSPQVAAVPPVTNMRIMMNSGGRSVAFARIVFTFDTSKIRMASEITTTGQMSTTVEKTSMNNANTTGRATIVIAASPSDNPPNGIFEFASFDIDANTGESDIQTYLNFDQADSQLVDAAGPEIPTQYTDAVITVHGSAISGTPPVSECPRGPEGNLDCDTMGCVDTADFELFRQAYGKTVGEISVPAGQHTPDLVTDSFNMIDTADYEILRANFGSCQ